MKLKLRKIGNSWGVIFPMSAIKDLVPSGVIEIEIKQYTEPKVTTPAVPSTPKPIPKAPQNNYYAVCPKHKGYKGKCGCK